MKKKSREEVKNESIRMSWKDDEEGRRMKKKLKEEKDKMSPNKYHGERMTLKRKKRKEDKRQEDVKAK